MAVSMSSGISPGLSPHSRVGHDENPFGTGGGGFHSLQEAVEGEEEDGEVEEKEVGWKDGEGTEEEWSDSLSGTVSHHYEVCLDGD